MLFPILYAVRVATRPTGQRRDTEQLRPRPATNVAAAGGAAATHVTPLNTSMLPHTSLVYLHPPTKY